MFLDAGGTLFRPFPSVGGVYARAARRHGCRVSAAWVEGRFRREWRRRNGLSGLRSAAEQDQKDWWAALVRRVFGRRMPRRRFSAFFEELYHLFAEPSTWRLFPDALATLEALRKRGFRVGVVSNWDSRLFRLCDGLGVTRRVDFVLASAVEGCAKPRPGIFRKALKLAGVRPAEALHVGDSVQEDYAGARRAGLRAVLVCRRGPAPRGVASVPSLARAVRLFGDAP